LQGDGYLLGHAASRCLVSDISPYKIGRADTVTATPPATASMYSPDAMGPVNRRCECTQSGQECGVRPYSYPLLA